MRWRSEVIMRKCGLKSFVQTARSCFRIIACIIVNLQPERLSKVSSWTSSFRVFSGESHVTQTTANCKYLHVMHLLSLSNIAVAVMATKTIFDTLGRDTRACLISWYGNTLTDTMWFSIFFWSSYLLHVWHVSLFRWQSLAVFCAAWGRAYELNLVCWNSKTSKACWATRGWGSGLGNAYKIGLFVTIKTLSSPMQAKTGTLIND